MSRKRDSYYPVFLKINGRQCVVVGGGEVALRKVSALLGHGASVKVISPELCKELDELVRNRTITLERRRYQHGDLHGAFLAIAATDECEVNLGIVEEAREQGTLVNVVDDAANSDFIVPSCLNRGDITIAVSTSGRSPALARKIRTRLEKEFGEEYAALAVLVDEVRAELRGGGIKVSAEDWLEALNLDYMLDLLKTGDIDRVRSTLIDNLKSREK